MARLTKLTRLWPPFGSAYVNLGQNAAFLRVFTRLDAAGISIPPIFSGSAELSTQSAILTSDGLFNTIVFSGEANLSVIAQLIAEGLSTPPIFSGEALCLVHPELLAEGYSLVPTFSGAAYLITNNTTLGGAATEKDRILGEAYLYISSLLTAEGSYVDGHVPAKYYFRVRSNVADKRAFIINI